MNRIKLTVITLLVTLTLMLGVNGCGEELLIGGAIGSAVTSTVEGANADLDRQIQEQLDRKAYLINQLETNNTEVGFLAAQVQIKAIEVDVERLKDAKRAVNVAHQAVSTDWRNPAETAPWIAAAVSTLIAALQNKKQRNVSALLKQLQQGVNSHMVKTDPIEAEKLKSRIDSYVASPVMQ